MNNGCSVIQQHQQQQHQQKQQQPHQQPHQQQKQQPHQQQQQHRSIVHVASHGVEAGIEMAGKYMVDMSSPPPVTSPLPNSSRLTLDQLDSADLDYATSKFPQYSPRFS
jgi:hypothetical protein